MRRTAGAGFFLQHSLEKPTIVLVTEVVNKLQTSLSRDQRGVERQTRVVTLIVLSEEYKEFVRLIPGVIPGEEEDTQDTRVFKERFFNWKIRTKSSLARQISIGFRF